MDVGRINPPLSRNRIVNNSSSVNDTKTTNLVEMQKAFGGKDLDQVLNGVADPKYAQKKNRVRGVGSDELGKDAFLKLMMAQLKQQDPTNPLKSHEMAAQLAQFSSVEQLTNIRSAIEGLSQKDDHDQFKLLGLIGKTVGGDSAQLRRTLGDTAHKIEFHLPASADRAVVRIKNTSGQEIKKYELGHLKAGKNIMTWNGLKNDDSEASVGSYRVEVDASQNGKPLRAKTQFSGTVDGVTFTKEGPMLLVGGKKLSLKDIQSVSSPKVEMPTKIPHQGSLSPLTGALPVPNSANSGLPRTNSYGSVPPRATLAEGASPTGPAVSVTGRPSAPQVAAGGSLRQPVLRAENKNVFQKPHLRHEPVGVHQPLSMAAMDQRRSKGAYEAPKIKNEMANLKMAGELKQKLMGMSQKL